MKAEARARVGVCAGRVCVCVCVRFGCEMCLCVGGGVMIGGEDEGKKSQVLHHIRQ
jgi:hypothetical protein